MNKIESSTGKALSCSGNEGVATSGRGEHLVYIDYM
jgi:hypothetical protein